MCRAPFQEVTVGRLDDRVAIITGSGRGIGHATALRLAEEGAAIVVNDLDPEPAQETVSEIEKNGGRGISVAANILEAAERSEERRVGHEGDAGEKRRG